MPARWGGEKGLANAEQGFAIAEEDATRARIYGLLGRLLVAPPDGATLAALRPLGNDESEFGRALGMLAAAARDKTPAAVTEEYEALFIGLTQGELLPYGSYYLAGFLHERPLARLRGDMAVLGIARREKVSEPEDHIGALCEMMSGLIAGAFAGPVDIATQQRFFDTHLGSWAPRFFDDLAAAPSADFYRPVATLGRLFMSIEAQAFQMAA
jgi:TorA maturation chaperone TorD